MVRPQIEKAMTQSPPLRTKISVLAFLAFFAWIGGAFFAGLYFNFDQKRQCIKDEGWVKGYLWCSTETRTSFVGNMLQGLLWPVYVFGKSSHPSSDPLQASAALLVAETKLTDEAFRNSRVGMMYICWSLALRTDQKDAANSISSVINIFRKKDQALDAMHDDYLTMAGQKMKGIEQDYGFESYYADVCKGPVEKMEQALEQGMLQ